MIAKKIILHSNSKSERGQSLVEFTLSITVLMLFLAGTIDLGRAFFTYMAMRDAVQEGASYGSISPASASAIEERARTSSTFPVDLTTADITVNSTVTGSGCAGDSVTVNMTYAQFPLLFPFSNVVFGQNHITLATSVTDTILLPLCP